MSMPVEGGPGGPLGYAWSRRARQTGTAGAGGASPLQDEPPQIVTSLRDDLDPGASRDARSLREHLASRSTLPSPDTRPMRSSLSAREGASSRDGLDAQDSQFSGDPRPPRSSQPLRDRLPLRDALHSHDAPHLRPTLLPEPPLASAERPIFASAAWLRGVVLAAGGALGFLWVTPANQQAGKEVALMSVRKTPGPAAQSAAAERAPDTSAAAEQAAATGAALYQEFLKWLQLRGR
jgi:hypothetical protein